MAAEDKVLDEINRRIRVVRAVKAFSRYCRTFGHAAKSMRGLSWPGYEELIVDEAMVALIERDLTN